MIFSGLKNEKKVSELLLSGSLAIKTKNESGIHLFEEKNAEAGIISGKLKNAKYDENEVLKSIDTTIIELLPIAPPPLDDTVPRPIYNEATQSIIDLTEEVTRLNEQVLDLTAKVTELEIVSESLRVEVDAQSIYTAEAQNNASQVGLKIQTSVVDLSNAIQKATLEAIQRVSLSSRIASLEEQNRQYKEILDGKDAKLAEGSKVGMDISLKVLKKGQEGGEDILFNSRASAKGEVTWINGPDIEVYNFGSEAVDVSFESTGETGDTIQKVANITLESKAKKTIVLSQNKGAVKDKVPANAVGTSRDKLYRGSFIAKTKSSTVTLTVGLQKQRGNKFEG
jgi:hypothetical protein